MAVAFGAEPIEDLRVETDADPDCIRSSIERDMPQRLKPGFISQHIGHD
jgi:hypothetical protein